VGQASQTTQAQPVAIDESSAITRAAEKVSPAIVTISVTGAAQNPNDPFFSIPESGVGSGVIFDSNGWIVTNKHVAEGAQTLTVSLADGRTFDGKVYGIDTLTDLAIVKVDATGLPTAPIGDSSTMKVGQLAIAIAARWDLHQLGHLGEHLGFGGTIQVQDGTVIRNLIQPTRPSPRNSAERCSTPAATSSASTPAWPRRPRASASHPHQHRPPDHAQAPRRPERLGRGSGSGTLPDPDDRRREQLPRRAGRLISGRQLRAKVDPIVAGTRRRRPASRTGHRRRRRRDHDRRPSPLDESLTHTPRPTSPSTSCGTARSGCSP